MLGKKKFILVALLLAFAILTIFKSWLIPGTISAGDLPYYFPQMMHGISFLSTWDVHGAGMGSNILPTLWIELWTTATLKAFYFLTWDAYIRFVWLFPYLIFSTISSFFLSRWYFKNGLFNFLTPFLYVGNTYALLLVGGGQMGIALSYAVAPLSIIAFENFLRKLTIKSTVIFSVAFAFVFLLDIRIGYILLWLLGIRFLFEIPLLSRIKIRKYLLLFPLSGILIASLHSFWLLPTLITHGEAIQQFGEIYTSKGAVQFFSFAKFENALGLLHPNWPENIFGFIHFMRPEFLLLPILAFGSLLFIGKKRSSLRLPQVEVSTFAMTRDELPVLFFVILGLVGIFLAKGTNDPFGFIYLWMFDHVPGFIMFRDPTKWYFLIVISYSVLIPFSLDKISIAIHDIVLNSKYKVLRSVNNILNTKYIILYTFIIYLLFLIRPAVFGELNGTFKINTIPPEYKRLAEYISSQKTFSRTLWIPKAHRFGFFSENHPTVHAYDFFHVASISGVIDMMHKDVIPTELRDSSIKYVIVPYDSEGEIFLKDRKYSQSLFIKTDLSVSLLPYLREMSGFGKIHVYKIENSKDHFWISESVKKNNINVSYIEINPTQYTINIKDAKKGDRLVFSDSYDSHWVARINSQAVNSNRFENSLNSFILPRDGSYSIEITYTTQKWVNLGLALSGFTLLGICFYLLLSKSSGLRVYSVNKYDKK